MIFEQIFSRRQRPLRIAVLAVGLALALGVQSAAWAASSPHASTQSAPGDLDPTFGSGGIVITSIGTSSNDHARSVAIQPDGKIVVAGYGGSPRGFAVARYNSDGSLDTGFGTNGIAWVVVGDYVTEVGGVAIQPDGKIVVSGRVATGGLGHLAVIRLNADGSPDASFGSGGALITPIFNGASGRSVAIQSDNKIVIAGYTWTGSSYDIVLLRYESDGNLDATFDSDGIVTTSFGGNELAFSLALQPDGRMVVAGTSTDATGMSAVAIVRYNGDGSLDSGFGSGGAAIVDIGSSYDQGHSVAIQPDGKIVVAGGSRSGSYDDIAIVRLNGNGSPDSGFGTGGVVTTSLGTNRNDYARSVAIQPDGKIVVTGSSAPSSNHDIVLLRYNSDGSLDTAFDSDGIVITDLGTSYDIGFSVTIQSDGKIVVAGERGGGSQYHDFVVLRYPAASPNIAPVAVDDAYSVDEDNALTEGAPGVLGNDTDADGDLLTAVLDSDASHGTLALNADGSFSYTPEADYFGPDSFTYVAHDGELDSGIATVTITINPVNDVPLVDAGPDTTVGLGGAFCSVGSFSDPDADTWTATVDYGEGSGPHLLALNPDRTFSLLYPYADPGSYTVTVTVDDGAGGSGTGAATVTVIDDGDLTSRASVDSNGCQANGSSSFHALSADGRYVVFTSSASNLVADDTNGVEDVFVRDQLTGETIRVSVDSSGGQANDTSSGSRSISADGRYVVFTSVASNLVVGDTNGRWDIFLHDTVTHETTRVSVNSSGAQANRNSYGASISADGNIIAFHSDANNLVAGDTNGMYDVFVHDRTTGETTRVSVDSSGAQGNERSYTPALSADGRYVAFYSRASNLVADDTNDNWDVFVHDRLTGQTTRVSVDSSGGQVGGAGSDQYALSADGRYVAFTTNADALVAGDTNGDFDVFVHDRVTGETTRVSLDSSGGQGNGASQAAAISADGRHVTFHSTANNLVAGDTNNVSDIFVHDRVTGQTTRISLDSSGGQANGASQYAVVSADGRYVAFQSDASNLVAGDTNGATDIFVYGPRNIAPTAGGDAYSVDEDNMLAAGAPGLLGNDSDLEGDPLTAALVSDASHGTLSLNADGSFSYTPEADYFGPDSFTYVANDGELDSNSVTVTITVNPVNDAPLAADDAYSIFQDSPLTVSAPGLLGNDSDVEGDPLTAVLVSDVGHGTLTLNADGSFSYTPAPDFAGVDSFTYAASDGDLDSSAATVVITVYDTAPPTITITRVTAPADGHLPEQSFTTFPATVGAQPATLSGTVTDNVEVYWVEVNGIPVTVQPDGTWTAAGLALTVGDNPFTATATDTNGNQASAGVQVTLDFDLDADGIQNNVDLDPVGASTRFSDLALGGTTLGRVVKTDSGVRVDVLDASAPEGLRLIVSGPAGSSARVSLSCSRGRYVLTPGEYVFTCNTVTMTVLQGQAEVEYVIDDVTVTVVVEAGSTVLLEETIVDDMLQTLDVVVDEGLVTINGVAVGPGESLAVTPVPIDIKPGSKLNAVNCNNPKGVIAVAILSTADFDAHSIDPNTVRFGPAGAEEIHRGKDGHARLHIRDVNGDGLDDLVLHFRYGDTGLTCADVSAGLTGQTTDGAGYVVGTDTITNKPKWRPSRKCTKR